MQKLYRGVRELLINGWAWVLDYLYVSFWQVYGFFVRSDAKKYKSGLASKPHILLIPGIYENWRFMKPIADMLHKKGYRVHIVSALGYNTGGIETMADIVLSYLKESALQDFIIVAHSKGGLIGKHLLLSFPSLRIGGMVTLNTPFAGSPYAHLFPMRGIRIFLPNSPTLTSLAENTIINKKIVSIYGIFDPHIPQGSFLDGANNVQLRTRGHFRIMSNAEVHSAVLQGIAYLTKK